MKAIATFSNRLGNRANNEDRCLVIEKPGRVLLAVADGMGGHARGELASQTTVDSFTWQFEQQRRPVNAPPVFLQMMLENAHFEVVQAGRREQPPVQCRTTCVTCLVQGDHAWWAHVGDSRLYLLRDGRLVTRTRDHTPVEDMMQSGLISEAEIATHPLRNSVSRCLGGAVAPQPVTFDDAALQAGDVLLLCSDGLWSALPEQDILDLCAADDLAAAVEALAERAEKASYPHSDNISAVALRWLAAEPGDVDSGEEGEPVTAEVPSEAAPATPEEPKDPLEKAIEDIERAIREYAPEMKK